MYDFRSGLLGSYAGQFYSYLGCGFLGHERVLPSNIDEANIYLEFLPLVILS
jgi:hypothetical protein